MLSSAADEVLATTRAVRFRLDLERPVARELITECVDLAAQAPTGRNRQRWRFVIYSEPDARARVADLCRRPGQHPPPTMPAEDDERAWRNPKAMQRVMEGQAYLMTNLHRVPVLLMPCIYGRTDAAPLVEQAGTWGSILPAVWSFMLAARARQLGTVWTTPPAIYEPEALDGLGLPDTLMPAAIIPVAHTLGSDFKRASRVPIAEIVDWR